MCSPLASDLLRWYSAHARQLPWRGSRDPYAIWVSEVMLQQTRTETVSHYYARWMERFPTVEALAEADRQEVLAQWEGLGYYRRAHNLHRAAELVAAQGGRFPSRSTELQRLPGVGGYTAAAIAALAFDEDVIALDGNLRRVLARLIDLEIDPRSSEAERQLKQAALGFLPRGRASAFNQALMDLGALICKPQAPQCPRCPLEKHCLARARGVEDVRPVKSPPRQVPHYQVAAGVIRRAGKVLIARRPEGKLLGGLWEFPGGKLEGQETLAEGLRRELREELGVEVKPGKALGLYRHAYTHFRVSVHALECSLEEGEPRALAHSELNWVDIDRLADHPMGKVDRSIANDLAGGRAGVKPQ